VASSCGTDEFADQDEDAVVGTYHEGHGGFAGRRIAGVWRTRRKRRVRQRMVFAGRIEALKSVWNGESDVAVGPSP
jgi:hypothetical protein